MKPNSPLITTLNFAKLLVSIFTLILFGCASNPIHPNGTTEPIGEVHGDVISNSTEVHVAFAGGGWRAHTGHSAWIISLLDNSSGTRGNTLNAAFTNVSTISSNSGGSWFSTMLMYSEAFKNDIEAPNAIHIWDQTGWIGLQQKHFNLASYEDVFGTTYRCSHHLGSDPNIFEKAEYIDCVSDYYAGSSYYWKRVIDSLIFKDYSLGTQTLSDPKLPWARGKSLLIASSLLTNSVVLNEAEEDLVEYQRYYQACLQDSAHPRNVPRLEGDENKKTTTCSAGMPKDVAAVTFSSLAPDARLTPLPFFRELNKPSYLYNIGYTKDYPHDAPPIGAAVVSAPLDYSEVPVMTAAAASSAASGFAASEHLTGSFDISYAAADEALSFGLVNSTVKFIDAASIPFEGLSRNKMVRLADGGPVDNSGVAQIVSFLQKNNKSDDFNIVAFDNVAEVYSPGGTGADLGIDLASLFGAPDPFSYTKVFDILGEKYTVTYKIVTPQLQIFDSNAMTSTPVTWMPADSIGQQIFYTKYTVTTIDNEDLGIVGGHTGTLHAFTYSSADASIIPDRGNVDFQAYSNMIKYIHKSLNATNPEGERLGLYHLRQAFGSTTAQ